MVPRSAMQATKNQNLLKALSFVALVLLLAGCTPAGPRALLDGKALLDQGRYAEAVEKLTLATSLMATNAQAWNYLGLARQQAGDASEAVTAYRQALRLDRELVEAHYNLGCLWLDQGKPDAAKSEFTACTLRRANFPEAWLKLGAAQFRLLEFTAAGESFQKALQQSPNHPEALNGLGLVAAQRKRPRDAAQYFNAALKQRPNYRPALLNLATVLHRDFNDPASAAQKYREYLALQPRAADWDSVNAILQSLEARLAPAPRPAVTNPPPPSLAKTNEPKPQPTVATRAPVTNLPVQLVAKPNEPKPPAAPVARTPVTNPPPPVAAKTNEPKPQPVVAHAQPVASPPPQIVAKTNEPKPAAANPPAPVRNNPPPVVSTPAPAPAPTKAPAEASKSSPKSAPRVTPLPPEKSTQPASTPASAPPPAPAAQTASPKPDKRNLISRLNPFRKNPTPAAKPTPLATAPAPGEAALSNAGSIPESSTPRSSSRYPYQAPAVPAPGDRAAAKKAFTEGATAQAARKLPEAAAAFQRAVQADGSFFEAHYNLGLAQYGQRDYAHALPTWERALAVKPDSADARYMFALTLNAAGYTADAAAESEKVLATNADDARAHLLLGKLCAEQLQDKTRARIHYQRLLELDPRNPNATQIRYWLVANPA